MAQKKNEEMKEEKDEKLRKLAINTFGDYFVTYNSMEKVREIMQDLLDSTPEKLQRSKNIIEQRLNNKTLQKVATELGLSRERVRQLEAKWYEWARRPKVTKGTPHIVIGDEDFEFMDWENYEVKMNEFRKYMHIAPIGHSDTKGILTGTVVIQPKIDGENYQLWWADGQPGYGSRNKDITGQDNGSGFKLWVESNDQKLRQWFTQHPSWRLYGEWLIPHTLRTYLPTAWRKFYIFDVYDDEQDRFVPYQFYQPELERFGFDYIPILATLTNPTEQELSEYLYKNTYLIEPGKGYGEGLIIKNYDFVNKYGRVVWGKIVRGEFKEEKVVMQTGLTSEEQFAQTYVTKERINKELSKNNAMKPQELYNRIYHDLVTTELWDFINRRKNNVTINFNELKQQIIKQINKETN